MSTSDNDLQGIPVLSMLKEYSVNSADHTARSSTRHPPLTVPEKLSPGADFKVWELATRRYAGLFPAELQVDVVIGLLSNDSLAKIVDEYLPGEIEGLFNLLRRRLSGLHPALTYRTAWSPSVGPTVRENRMPSPPSLDCFSPRRVRFDGRGRNRCCACGGTGHLAEECANTWKQQVRHMKLEKMAATVQTLQYFQKENSLQQSVFSRLVEVTESGTEGATDAVCQAFSVNSGPDEKALPVASSGENKRIVAEEAVSVSKEKEAEPEEKEKREQEAKEDDEEEEREQQEEVGERFYQEKEAQETRCIKIDQDVYPEEVPQKPKILKIQENAMSTGIGRTRIKPEKSSFYQPNHNPLPSWGFGTFVQKRIRIWKIYHNRKKKNKARKRLKGRGVMRRRKKPWDVEECEVPASGRIAGPLRTVSL
ncbi:unnamed protein product [Calicophoron daubneyi]|uniref:CCHC-type domain-containing protein n=1 Tax=Calicophoron daubneyi TaxID=300641 RepID=A0AAV2T7E7_CALDB